MLSGMLGNVVRARNPLKRELLSASSCLAQEDVHLLYREFSHRIRNQLQVLLCALEPPGAEALRGAAEFPACRAVIEAMAKVHELLCRCSSGDRVDGGRLVAELSQALHRLYASGRPEIRLSVDCPSCPLAWDTGLSFGLAAAEMISNAYKHGFPGGCGSLVVRMRRKAGTMAFSVCSIPEEPASAAEAGGGYSSGFGALLLAAMTEKLRGFLETRQEKGRLDTLSFPLSLVLSALPEKEQLPDASDDVLSRLAFGV